jgi:hypothetical protein
MKQAYEDAQAKLMDKNGNPTPHYQAYLEYEEKYKDKVKVRDEAYASALTDPMKLQMWPVEGVMYHDDVEKAMDQWVSFGHKEEIENALATLAAQGTDPNAVIKRNSRSTK